MKRLFVLVALLFAFSVAHASKLVSNNLSTGAFRAEVRVDGTKVSECGKNTGTCVEPHNNGLRVSYNIDNLIGQVTPVTFEARACNESDVCSSWSQPFTANLLPPEVPGGLNVIVTVTVVLPGG